MYRYYNSQFTHTCGEYAKLVNMTNSSVCNCLWACFAKHSSEDGSKCPQGSPGLMTIPCACPIISSLSQDSIPNHLPLFF